MLFTEFNMEDALEIRGEEKFAEGLAEGKAEGKAEGLAEGKAEGKAEGVSTGEDRFAHLAEHLMKDQRLQDLLRATEDREFRKTLYLEYEMENGAPIR